MTSAEEIKYNENNLPTHANRVLIYVEKEDNTHGDSSSFTFNFGAGGEEDGDDDEGNGRKGPFPFF